VHSQYYCSDPITVSTKSHRLYAYWCGVELRLLK